MVRSKGAQQRAARIALQESSSSETVDGGNDESRRSTRSRYRSQQNDSDSSDSDQPLKGGNQSRTSRNQPSTSRNQPSTSRNPPQPNKNQPQGASRRKQNQPQPLYLREIIKLQMTTNRLIPRLPFGRCLKEILQSHGGYRITRDAFDAFHEASEIYLVQLLEDSYKLTLHRQRVTLMPGDIELVLYLRGSCDPGNA